MRVHRYRRRAWSAVAFAAVLSAAAALAPHPGAAAQADSGVEFDGADCPVPDPGSTAATPLLPDPFTKLDGTRISAESEWRCRRAEIKELAESSVYGHKPARPDSVTGSVSGSEITVNVTHQGRSAGFSASVDLPSGSGPFPAVVVLGGLGADTQTIKSSGAAVVEFDPYQVGEEGTGRDGKQGAFYSIYGSSSETGLLMAWSWGVSRIIDVIEQSDGSVLQADSTGVTGCSRFGKGAFVSGAFDQRIDLTMPVESGTAGVPAFRSVAQEDGAQPLSSAYSEQPWLGDAFSAYTQNPDRLPVDTHEIVAMVAPRGLFIMENPHVDWLGATSGSVAALGGAEVYKALGAEENISYSSDVQDGTHCASRSEWQAPLRQSIEKFLLGTGSAPGEFRIAPSESGDLSQWRSWQTPTLDDSGGGDPGDGDPGDGDPGDGDPGDGDPGDGGAEGACTADFRAVNSWSGGYQGEVTVNNTASGALDGWSVAMTLASGQSISNLWNGEYTSTGGSVTVSGTGWNGTVPVGGSATFGFVASGSSAAPTDITCTTP
ncbi:glucuronyl esterase domain-containing protein [Streptomonospora litoralis]|uniref:Endo-1,4-beta-xylanase A n=1 Tax=Streptomonospora litoralis TaxID=2498135 RepID=A0A4P6PZD1_9ACTN|nr:cellulose binding domain-containing protein [Streptomonospora litoralis]QBI53618.1 Endo-1,4-beta-xylanase A precursor [Streptomonospora litoralis]